jgi:membrane protease YdiL (CAAX protease family)
LEIKRDSIPRTDTSIWIFFVLAYVLSWVFWMPATQMNSERLLILAVILYVVGGFGPTVAGIIMIDRTEDKEGQRDFLRRLFSFKQIGCLWYAFIFLVFPLLAILTTLVYRLVQGCLPSLPALDRIASQPQQLIGLPIIALQVLLAGPLSEEIGWRGFALDRLQERWNALIASLVLGGGWTLWHTPLFFVKGTMYNDWGFGTALFWLFLMRMVSLSLIMTWVYNNNGNSILSAVLLHFTFNFTFGFFHPAPNELHLYGTLLFMVFATAVTMIWGAKMLTR